jgi:hypothetical protein
MFENENEDGHDAHLLIVGRLANGDFVVGEYCTAQDVMLSPVIIKGEPLTKFTIQSVLHPFDTHYNSHIVISGDDLVTAIPLDIGTFSALFNKYAEFRKKIDLPLPDGPDEESPLESKFRPNKFH